MLGPEGGGHPGNDSYDVENQSLDDRRNHSSSSPSYSVASQQQQQQKEATHHSVLNVHVVSNDESLPHQNGSFISGNPAPQVEIEAPMPPLVESPKKPDLSRNSSSHEQCRVCQQENDEALIDLGCHCRGGLAKAHQSCITAWFSIRGSNKCEICQQIAANVALPESQASTSYWVWRLDPAYRGRAIGQGRERGCFSPLWVAFSILIGGLLLDVLISITLGVSALPVNIIIGVIVVLGLGTALRLALEFCHEWSLRRVVHRVEANASLGYHPAL